MSYKRIAIVTGASGDLGRSYIEKFSGMGDTRCVAVSRYPVSFQRKNIDHIEADLLECERTRDQIMGLSLDNAEEVYLIHCVGKFKVEFSAPAIMDMEVYDSNVNTFKNVVFPLLENEIRSGSHCRHLGLCAFGTVSDSHKGYQLWPSFKKSKKYLRDFQYDVVHDNLSSGVTGTFIRLSSVNTGRERDIRPNADKTYWLDTGKIADDSIPVILDSGKRWKEVNIILPKPDFDPTEFTDAGRLAERWKREMGFEE
jgi:hypothetical protein